MKKQDQKNVGVVIYCRVSSQEQVQGTSLDGQKQSCLDYAEAKGMKVLKIFIEKGESATAANRTELIKGLDFCRDNKGKVHVFLVWKLDRFSRNKIDHFALKAQLIKYGVSLHSVTEQISDDPMGKLTEGIVASYAEFENDIRKMRCEGGMQRKIEEGIWPWHPPIGYNHSKTRTDRRKNLPDEVDTIRLPIIIRGLKAYARGEHTITSLAAMFNQWGLKTRTGKPMFKQLVNKMLTDKYYTGVLVSPFNGEEYPGLHVPAINIDEYDQIQFIKAGRSNNAIAQRLHYHPDFSLRGLVRCSCGDRITASWQTGRGGKKYGYYRCNNETCPNYNLNIRKGDLEKRFLELLETVTPSEKFLKVFRATVVENWKSAKDDFTKIKNGSRTEIVKLEGLKLKYAEMRAGGEIDMETFKLLNDKVTNQITGLKISSNESEIEELDLEAAIAYVEQFVTNIARQWLDLTDIKRKQRLQRLVLPEGLTFDRNTQNFGTAILSPVFSLSEKFQNSPSDFVAGVGFEPTTSGL